MIRLLKRIRHEERGFTLIELLIVVGILAVLAGVVTLGINQFIGRGRTEAANTELHNVQTAVTGLMADLQIPAFSCAAGDMDNIGDIGNTGLPVNQIYVPCVSLGGVCSASPNPCTIAGYIVTNIRGEYTVTPQGRVGPVANSY